MKGGKAFQKLAEGCIFKINQAEQKLKLAKLFLKTKIIKLSRFDSPLSPWLENGQPAGT